MGFEFVRTEYLYLCWLPFSFPSSSLVAPPLLLPFSFPIFFSPSSLPIHHIPYTCFHFYSSHLPLSPVLGIRAGDLLLTLKLFVFSFYTLPSASKHVPDSPTFTSPRTPPFSPPYSFFSFCPASSFLSSPLLLHPPRSLPPNSYHSTSEVWQFHSTFTASSRIRPLSHPMASQRSYSPSHSHQSGASCGSPRLRSLPSYSFPLQFHWYTPLPTCSWSITLPFSYPAITLLDKKLKRHHLYVPTFFKTTLLTPGPAASHTYLSPTSGAWPLS